MKKAIALTLFLSPVIAYAGLGDKLYVKPLQAHVYIEPSATSGIKITLGKGRKIVELQRKAGYINVHIDRTGGMSGWIKAKDTNPADSDGIR